MIYPAKYNGINFSYDINREAVGYNFDNQRSAFMLRHLDFKYLSFFATGVADETLCSLDVFTKVGSSSVAPAHTIAGANAGEWYFYFDLQATDFLSTGLCYFSFSIAELDTVYSEWCNANQSSEVLASHCHIIAKNADDRHGFLSREAFGFFKYSLFRGDVFMNKAVVYEYSYSRKKILSSENQIVKRFTFYDLTMYQQNLLKWLCNCETVTINGTAYQLISDFSELENDENTEIKSLRADFVEATQSFFSEASTAIPKNIFSNNYFMA